MGSDIVRNRLLGILTILAGVAALKLGYPVIMPLVVAAFIIAAAWPTRDWFSGRLPDTISYILTIAVLFVILATFFGVIAYALAQVVQTFYDKQEELRQVYDSYIEFAQRHGLPTPASGSDSETSGFDRLVQVGRMFIANVYQVLSYLGVVAVIVIMGFPAVPAVAQKFRRQFRLNERREIADTIKAIAEGFRSYIAMTLLASLITGVASGLWSLAVGLDLALIWGILNFLLNFIPVVGNIVGILPPTLYAFIQFGGITMPIVVFVGFSVLQLVISNFIYPMLQARGLSMPPITVIVSLLFWGWIWGFAGALLAVPLTAVVIVVAREFEVTRRYAIVLGSSRDSPETESRPAEGKATEGGEPKGE